MDELPEEILLAVFEYLTKSELITASGTCERWYSIIASSSFLLHKIPRTINPQNLERIKNSALLPLKNVEVNPGNQIYENKVKKLLDEHKNFIEKIHLSLPTPSFVSSILENLETLQHLTINASQNTLNKGGFLVHLPNLKSLNVSHPASYLRLIKSPQLEELTINDTDHDRARICKATNSFLKKCESLKKFSYSGKFPFLDHEEFTFKLESFSLFLVCDASDDYRETALDFMDSQRNFIKKLTLRGFLNRELIQLAVNKMKLEELSVDMDKIFAEFKELEINSSIKRLEILKFPNDVQIIAKFIAHCSEVESLTILPQIEPRDFDEIMLKVSQALEYLKHLTVHSIPTGSYPQMVFNRLESLTVAKCRKALETELFMDFSLCCPRVKHLKIKNLGSSWINEDSLCDFLTNLKSIETFYIAGNLEFDEGFFEAISRASTSLKQIFLEVPVDHYSYRRVDEMVRILDGSTVQVIIPDLNKHRRMIWEDENDEESSCEDNNELESEENSSDDSTDHDSDSECSEDSDIDESDYEVDEDGAIIHEIDSDDESDEEIDSDEYEDEEEEECLETLPKKVKLN